jgi:predicted flap endonuclease-1-like 5' DNA nuclease
MFSTFMLNLLAEIYATFPEEGDLDQPKLVLFIDEAHLIFNEASKALLEQIETIVRLIRSKGVGVIFCTQQPTDVPDNVLAQLGLKVQHGLRAFTAKDRKMIKAVSENYPLSDFYKTDELLTHLGIGEALITGLNEKGIPTPLVHTLLCAPRSRMDILTADELGALVEKSQIAKHYNQMIDSVSAHEMLTEKLVGSKAVGSKAVGSKAVGSKAVGSRQSEEEEEDAKASASQKRKSEKDERSVVEEVADSTVGRQVMRTVARELTRGLLGMLGIGSTRRRKSKWF